MNGLLLADLHLTATTREEYRWRLFSWLEDQLVLYSIQLLIILGDLTEAKDFHGARLVNRIVDSFARLHQAAGGAGFLIYLLRGNHDGTDPACPYFRFLRALPFCRYVETPFMTPLAGRENVLFLPHTRQPELWDSKMLRDAEVIFMHQTVSGAQAETGFTLEGMSTQALAAAKYAKIWSGDVHVPQVIGSVEYVGAPYPVRFGDSFKPRAVLLEKGLRQAKDLDPPRFGRHTLILDGTGHWDGSGRMAFDNTVAKGDQVKYRVRLRRSEFVNFEVIKREIVRYSQEAEVELCGIEVERVEDAAPRVRLRGKHPQSNITPVQTLEAWAAKQNLAAPLVAVGKTLLATVVK